MNTHQIQTSLRVTALLMLMLSVASATQWLPPIDDRLRLSASFDLPNGPYQAGHRGIDLHAQPNETIRSPVAGTVTFVGRVADRPVLSIRVDEHTVVSFEPITSELETDERVTRGSQIGTIDAGGHCEKRCLHLGVRVHGEYVNPLRYFWPRPVLLPW